VRCLLEWVCRKLIETPPLAVPTTVAAASIMGAS